MYKYSKPPPRYERVEERGERARRKEGREGGREGGDVLYLEGLDDVGGLGGGARGVGGGEAVRGLAEGQVVDEGGDVYLK
jgi:hypothetical protein